ncbi:MAG: hypothetical protein MJZ86_10760 [Bacteroidales bacterium]|nr:hypothetical protein [Bacteroidales bacterium]
MKRMGYTLIIIGAVLAVVGLVLVLHKPKVEVVEVVTPVEEEVVSLPISSDSAKTVTNEQKGRDFEIWVKDHFNQDFFNLKEWRGDKYDKGTYAESNRYPDMEWEFHFDKENVTETFAVECKWRSDFYNGSIEWASEENIAIYNRFAKERNMPVFVVIGVGGMPSAPVEVYVVPLKALQYPYAKKEYLEKFRHEDLTKKFYYQYKDCKLM